MASKTIYFDESGFTGYNLLDPAQPIFVVASTDIADDHAASILRDSFPRYQGPEIKFANIWKSKNREGLLRFGAYISDMQNCVFVWITDKRFAVLTKIVDFLIEPAVTNAGFDFYDEGFCWKYANYIHFGLSQFTPELYEGLIRAYQKFSRSPNEETLAELQHRLSIMVASNTEERVQVFLEQMEMGAQMFQRFNNLETFKGSDELQVSSMFAAITWWRSRHKEDFAVVHDASSNFMRGKEVWEAVTNADVSAQFHVAGDGSVTEFPLRVVSTTAANSKDSPSIQFCDVLAGLATRFFSPNSTGPDRDFMLQVAEAGLKDLTYNGVRPSTIFPDRIPPKQLDGPDAVDRMSALIAESRARRNSA